MVSAFILRYLLTPGEEALDVGLVEPLGGELAHPSHQEVPLGVENWVMEPIPALVKSINKQYRM